MEQAERTALAPHLVGVAVEPAVRTSIATPYQDAALVARLVREALLSGGLGQQDPEAPLRDIIRPGDFVLLKPNWVLEPGPRDRGDNCLVTDPVFIEAVVREVAATTPGRILIGDAPIQGCDFDAVVPREVVRRLTRAAGGDIEVADFRQPSSGQRAPDGARAGLRTSSQYVEFDLGRDSLLEPISTTSRPFRVTQYDPDRLAGAHRTGQHRYVLCREAFEADVILSLPKLKTHSKAGITGALKNVVGLVGSKDCLPHHRVGGRRLGGDCYPGLAPVKRLVEYCLDRGNRRIGTRSYDRWISAARALSWVQARLGDLELEGGWHGNDTIWRTVLDLQRILAYGSPDGRLSDRRQRRVYSLTDAIVAGEGDGPLSPEPRRLAAVTFASSPPHADLVHTGLMGFDWERIPLVRESFRRFRFPLVPSDRRPCEPRVGRRPVPMKLLEARAGLPFTPPAGWAARLRPAARPA